MVPVLVIGETCIDEFVYGTASRLAPEAPAPVFIPDHNTHGLGMAANVVENLKVLGVTPEFITNNNRITKTRYVDEKTNHLFLRVDIGDEATQPMAAVTKTYLSMFDVVVISDYCKGFISEQMIKFICENHPRVFVDTKKPINSNFTSAHYIKINKPEFKNSEKTIRDIPGLLDKVIVTLGDQGCRLGETIYPVPKVEVKDYAGAGDTFLAGLIVEYIRSNDIYKAIHFANDCATKVVCKRGVTTI